MNSTCTHFIYWNNRVMNCLSTQLLTHHITWAAHAHGVFQFQMRFSVINLLLSQSGV